MIRPTFRRGVIAPLFAVLLPAMIIVCAMAISIAQMELTRVELKIATDAAAHAGGRAWSEHQDLDMARSIAQQAAAANEVAGRPLVIDSAGDSVEIVFGQSLHQVDSRFEFTPVSDDEIEDGAPVSGIRVTATHPTPLLLRVGDTEDFTPTATSVASQIDRDIALVIDRSGSMAYFEDEDFLYNTITDLYNDSSNGISQDDYRNAVADYQPVPSLRAMSLNSRAYSDSVLNHLTGNLRQYALTLNSEYRAKRGDPDFSRWDLLEDAKHAFFSVLNENQLLEMVSTTSFASNVTIEVLLTSNLSANEAAIDNMYPTGSTAIGDGVIDAVDTLFTDEARPHAAKTIIVFTDGENKKGVEPAAAGLQVVSEHPNVIIHTVTFSPGADQVSMRALAEAANGKHYHADDGTELTEIFRELARSFRTIITE